MSKRKDLLYKAITINVFVVENLINIRNRLINLYDDWVSISLDDTIWQRESVLLKYSESTNVWAPVFLNPEELDIEDRLDLFQNTCSISREHGIKGAMDYLEEYYFSVENSTYD